MNNRKQRLELTWVGKDERQRLEPRILLHDMNRSYHAKVRVGNDDIFDNILIHGDNLLALRALEQDFSGRIKCIYIDPPYNTGSAFQHYDDGIEHSVWLSLMRDRLIVMHKLLSSDGSIWISADDNEGHYLKVLMDEVFGRTNFVSNVIWQKRYAPSNDALWLSENHDHIFCYAKNKATWRPYPLPRTSDQDKLYRNPDNDPRGPWMSDNYTCAKSVDERPNLYYEITNPNTGEKIWPKRTRVWGFDPAAHKRHVQEGRVYWGKDGRNSTPRLKKYLSELRRQGTVPQTIWMYEEVGHTQEAKREAAAFNPTDPFPTPKPERLIHRILTIATRPGDIVLDSFAGSGTTGAVAQKMGRRWIMAELHEHCHTHIVPRLKRVVDGSDAGGVTKAADWRGGGGFRYFRLAPSLLEKDRFGNWVVAKGYNAAMLAEAMCKLMGFTYAPSQEPEEYWRHGHSTEQDFIYVTTQSLTHDALKKLSDEVGPDRTLLVCCKAFNSKAGAFINLTLKKIPQAVLTKCEWGRDDYSLRIANLPVAESEEEDNGDPDTEMDSDAAPRKRGRRKNRSGDEPSLFNEEAEG